MRRRALAAAGVAAGLAAGATLAAAAPGGGPAGRGQCGERRDPHGAWHGSRASGENYTLVCHTGFQVDLSGTPSISLVCPETGHWALDATCVQHDDCDDLKFSCGPMGICTDRTAGYRCVCEHGYQLHRADNEEWVCGEIEKGVCSGATCGAYGVCVDLSMAEGNFDTGHVKQETSLGEDTYRCSCAVGFHDNGSTCVPLNCGVLSDSHGKWVGQPTVGGHYTLSCRGGAYVWGGTLQEVTMSCPTHGRWETVPVCVDTQAERMDQLMEEYHFWGNICMALVCVCCAACAAGLTIGMVSIEPFEMRMLLSTREEDCVDDEQRKKLLERQEHARKLLPFLEDHHLLLVTLLLLNSIANEALPIFLDELVPAAVAVALSVTAVLVFGEIVPSAIFTGPSQLKIAAMFTTVVRVFQTVFMCLAWPIARILDRLLSEGHDDERGRYNRAELRALLALHGPEPSQAEEANQDVSQAEVGRSETLKVERRTKRAGTFLARRSMSSKVVDSGFVGGPTGGCEDGGPLSHVGVLMTKRSLPETFPPSAAPTVDGFELALMSSVFTLRDRPLRACLDPRPLGPEHMIAVASDAASVRDGIRERRLHDQWLLVCDSGDSASSHAGVPTPDQLTQGHVIGVLGVSTLMVGTDECGPGISDTLPGGLADPVWLHADKSGLAAYRALVQASAARRKERADCGPVIGLVVGEGSRQVGQGNVLGALMLEDFALALACGPRKSAEVSRRPESVAEASRCASPDVPTSFNGAQGLGATWASASRMNGLPAALLSPSCREGSGGVYSPIPTDMTETP